MPSTVMLSTTLSLKLLVSWRAAELHKLPAGCIYPVMEPGRTVVDDAALLRQYARGGDAAAFAELVRRYADMVYATARRVTGSDDDALDVSQDCFLRLARGSAAITGSLAAWLHRTSLNRARE